MARFGASPTVRVATSATFWGRDALAVAAVGLAFVALPLVTLVFVCCLSALALHQNSRAIFLFSVVLLFCLLNLTKAPVGDLAIYLDVYEYVADRPITVLAAADELRGVSSTYRATEIGFYGPIWFAAHVFGGFSGALSVLATLMVYVPTYFALTTLAKRFAWNERLTLVVLFFACFAAINFVQTTHLLRQYISASITFLAFALFVSGHRGAAALFALAACTVHNASVIVIGNFAVLAHLFPLRTVSFGNAVLRAFLGLIALGTSLALLAFYEVASLGAPDQNISLLHYAVAAGLFVLFGISTGRFSGSALTRYTGIAFTTVWALSFSFFLIDFGLLALRYFAYLEWLFTIIVAIVLCNIPRRYLSFYVASRLVVGFFALTVFYLRLRTSPWAYGPEGVDVLALSVPGLVSYLN